MPSPSKDKTETMLPVLEPVYVNSDLACMIPSKRMREVTPDGNDFVSNSKAETFSKDKTVTMLPVLEPVYVNSDLACMIPSKKMREVTPGGNNFVSNSKAETFFYVNDCDESVLEQIIKANPDHEQLGILLGILIQVLNERKKRSESSWTETLLSFICCCWKVTLEMFQKYWKVTREHWCLEKWKKQNESSYTETFLSYVQSCWEVFRECVHSWWKLSREHWLETTPNPPWHKWVDFVIFTLILYWLIKRI